MLSCGNFTVNFVSFSRRRKANSANRSFHFTFKRKPFFRRLSSATRYKNTLEH